MDLSRGHPAGKDQRAHASDCSTMEGSETVLADVRMTLEH